MPRRADPAPSLGRRALGVVERALLGALMSVAAIVLERRVQRQQRR